MYRILIVDNDMLSQEALEAMIAGYEQFETKNGVLKMWNKTHIERICDEINKKKD